MHTPLKLALAVSFALLAPSAVLAQSAPAAKAAAPKAPAWVARSNQHAQVLLMAQAPFQPEQLSFFGVPGFDEQVADFGPRYAERFREATTKARVELQAPVPGCGAEGEDPPQRRGHRPAGAGRRGSRGR